MRSPSISLLCLPCAGASAVMYKRWRFLLPEWVNVIPVELPGRGGRFNETSVENFDTLVEQLCQEQMKHLTGCYTIFGHSMGALLAYGMVNYLRKHAIPMPRIIFASGSSAPSRRDPDRYSKVDDDSLIESLRKQNGTPEELYQNPEFMRILLDVLRSDYRVCNSFQYSERFPMPVPIHVFAGTEDDINGDQLTAWQRETNQLFSLSWFKGGHFFLRDQENLVLQAIVRELLNQLPAVAPMPNNKSAAIAAA